MTSKPTLQLLSDQSEPPKKTINEAKRANELDGKTWTQYSISIWSDIRKTPAEIALSHPASFPLGLIKRLIQIFMKKDQKIVLDPFAGIGTTLVAAQELNKNAIGIELSPQFSQQAQSRFNQLSLFDSGNQPQLYTANALDLLKYVFPASVDFVCTSPPYWNILMEKRTADYKEIRHYGNETQDLGKIADYQEFLQVLQQVFKLVYQVMKPETFCCVIVMDIRKKNQFYPFHSDLANFMQDIGFIYDDLIIWDRRHEYNNMRPLGYPYRFRINKAHEYILIFTKPKL